MKVLITGGHFSPAHSLIKELLRNNHEVAIAGRKESFEGDGSPSFEYEVAKKEKVRFYEIKTGRIQRKFTRHTIPGILKISRGLFDSMRVIGKYKPDVVVTFGGYVAFPVAYAAFLRRIPVILHEQTLHAGLASRAISRISKKICISFESSKSFFPANKVVFTGIPVRDEIFETGKTISLPADKSKPLLYVTGGSTGSHFLNSLVQSSLKALLRSFSIIHQTGGSLTYMDYEKLSEARESLPEDLQKRYIVRKYIFPEEIGYVLKASDLVVSRAGINITVEMLSLGKVCLLIPLPHGQANEQLDNAKFIREVGIGDYIEQKDTTQTSFLNKIREMMKNKSKYEKNRDKASDYIVNDSTERILAVIEEIYDKQNN